MKKLCLQFKKKNKSNFVTKKKKIDNLSHIYQKKKQCLTQN